MCYVEEKVSSNEYVNDKLLGATPSKLPLGEQETCIVRLRESVNILEKRLSSVLNPGSDSVDARSETTPAPSVSPLAEQLSANNRAINRITDDINSIMERLEC